MVLGSNITIVRQRILVTHVGPEEREVIEEFTLINNSSEKADNVFLSKQAFMIGLKILDEANNELPLFANPLTKSLISKELENDRDNSELKQLLEDIETRKKYILWIKISEKSAIPPFGSKIIKLSYKNKNLIKSRIWANFSLLYATVVFSLVALSILFSLISTKTIDSHILSLGGVYPFLQIYNHTNPLFAALVTVSLAAVGFMRTYSLNKTRFWFLIPIVLSAVGFLLKR